MIERQYKNQDLSKGDTSFYAPNRYQMYSYSYKMGEMNYTANILAATSTEANDIIMRQGQRTGKPVQIISRSADKEIHLISPMIIKDICIKHADAVYKQIESEKEDLSTRKKMKLTPVDRGTITKSSSSFQVL